MKQRAQSAVSLKSGKQWLVLVIILKGKNLESIRKNESRKELQI